MLGGTPLRPDRLRDIGAITQRFGHWIVPTLIGVNKSTSCITNEDTSLPFDTIEIVLDLNPLFFYFVS